MELSPRLRSVADQVPEGGALADVGTDHAYLPTWLLLNGRIPRAIAADLREGPLERARETAERYGVRERISFRLCDGLAAVGPEEADTIAIAGMGGETISAILAAAPWTAGPGKTLLLQPMTAFSELRTWLWGHGYAIAQETVSREGKRLYVCLKVQGGTMPPMTPGELFAGRQSSDPLRGAYLEMLADKLERVLRGLRGAAVRDEGQIEAVGRILEELYGMRKEL